MGEGERNAAILRRKLAGETYAAIGRDYGITGQRVRQIVEQVLERATTTEEERAAKKAALKAERARIVAANRADYERERAERERLARMSSLQRKVAGIAADWKHLNDLAWWLREHKGEYVVGPMRRGAVYSTPVFGGAPPSVAESFAGRTLEYDPTFRAVDRAVGDWYDGRANETMTVIRLRKLVEVA